MISSAASSAGPSGDGIDVDAVIAKLLEVRGSRPGKQVNIAEPDIRSLCTVAREIFMNQPVLLELEAPIKICGARALLPRKLPSRLSGRTTRASSCLCTQVTCMGSTLTCCACSNTVSQRGACRPRCPCTARTAFNPATTWRTGWACAQ